MVAPETLLALLQLVDSAFPTGAYAFSGGIEGLVEVGAVRDEADLCDLVATLTVEGLGATDLPAARHAHRLVGGTGAGAPDTEGLAALDDLLTALRPVPALRAQSTKVGRRLLASAAEVVDGPGLGAYRAAVAGGRAAGHHAVAFGVVMAAAGVDEDVAALALGSSSVAGWATAAVRLGVVGQAAAQRVVVAVRPAVLAAVAALAWVGLDDLGGYLPMVDIAALRQGEMVGRLFAS